MLDDFRLRVFKTLAEEGSFTKAADKLGISQPAVSQNIAELERQFSMVFFRRQKGSVELTKAGHVFLKYADSILASYSEAELAFAPVPKSVVSISASEELFAYFIAPVLQDFIAVHPEVTFERCMTDAPDLRIMMLPISQKPFDVPSDAIIRMKWELSPIVRFSDEKMGDPSATHEKTLFFDILFQPSPAFGCTRLCRIIREFLTKI